MNIPVLVTREPYMSLPCEYPSNCRVAWLTGAKIYTYTTKEPGGRAYLGEWQKTETRGSITREDLKKRDFDAVYDCNVRMKAQLSEQHRFRLQEVAAGFEAEFGYPPTLLHLQFAGWNLWPDSQPGSWVYSVDYTVAALDTEVDLDDPRITPWSEIPGHE